MFQAEEALRESEEKYRVLVEQSLQGLVIVQDACIVFANTAFAEITGYTVEELISLSPDEARAMVHPEDQASVRDRCRDALVGDSAAPRYECRLVRKDGSVCWLEMVVTRIKYNRKPAIQGAVVDTTLRMQVEVALVKTEKLAAVQQIPVIMNHEINDPLIAVLGYTRWLLSREETLSPEGRQALENIETAARQVRDVVRKLDRIEDRPVSYMGETMMIDIHGDE